MKKANFKNIGRTLGSKNFWKDALLTAGGVAISRSLPGIATAITKKDFSGTLPHIVSTAGVSMLFMAYGKNNVAIGNIAVNGAYLLQNTVSPQFAKITGTPLTLPIERNSFVPNSNTSGVSDFSNNLNDSNTDYVQLPDGTFKAITKPMVIPAETSSHANLNDFVAEEGLSSFVDDNLNDFVESPKFTNTLADDYAFDHQRWAKEGVYFN